MENYFALTLPKGSEIWKKDGTKQILNQVPKNAKELWEEGSRALRLRKAGLELLQGKTKEDLKQLLTKRQKVKNRYELNLIRKAIKSLESPSSEEE